MKLVAVYHKGRALGMISHLDVQRTLQRAFRRAGLPLLYSNGFNPHPQFSFATAAATGMSSDCEWFEVQLFEPIAPEEFVRRANAAMPEGLSVSDAHEPPEGFGSLSAKLRAALYRVELSFDAPVNAEQISQTLEAMLAGEIVVNKRTKSGVRPVDMRPYILEVSVEEVGDGKAVLRVLGKLQADGGLRVDAFVDALLERLDAQATYALHRMRMYFADDGFLPRLPSE